MAKCLCCYKELSPGEVDYHRSCIRRFFGTNEVPQMPFTHAGVRDLAKQVVRSQTTVTGVQSKLSLDIEKVEHTTRFTIVGLWGRFILKPQTELYPLLPENEDLTMHLAKEVGIDVVPHTLVRFADGELAYLTRRIDRTTKGLKLPMEDMCQLTERLTEHKYRGSYEQIAKAIAKYSDAPGLNVVDFWMVVLFSWLVGNSDMHFKNFSLYAPNDQMILTPAYDLVNTLLAIPTDTEELALTLNGKKSHLQRKDFEKAMLSSGMDETVVHRCMDQFAHVLPRWEQWVHNSFLSPEMQAAYLQLLHQRLYLLFA